MQTYLMFFESDIITSFEFVFNYLQRESIVKNKIDCSFLHEENSELGKHIFNSVNTLFPDCKIIKFGKITMEFEREFIVTFTIFQTKEILFENINGNMFPIGNFEDVKKKALEIRNSLSKSNEVMVVRRFVANIFLPEKLKDIFHRNIEKIAKNKKNETASYHISYYQNYKKFPFLVEFQTNLFINFKKKLDRTINEFYSVLSPLLNKTGTLSTFEHSFYDLNLYSFEKFDRSEVANSISNSLLEYIFSLYIRIIDSMTIYRTRIEFLSKKLKKFPEKAIVELNEQLNELKRTVFEEYPLLYISFLDRYIRYDENDEKPDLVSQIFSDATSYVNIFRRKIKLLNEQITKLQSDINMLLLYRHDRITSFTKDELKEKLESLKNEIEFQDLLAEILKELQFEYVTINCGRRGHEEFGKDIVFSHKNKFNQREWSAVVVKVGKITQGKSMDINRKCIDIIDQGTMALDINFKDDKGSKFKITKIFVATNDIITDKAKTVIVNKLRGQVFFIDKNILLDLVE